MFLYVKFAIKPLNTSRSFCVTQKSISHVNVASIVNGARATTESDTETEETTLDGDDDIVARNISADQFNAHDDPKSIMIHEDDFEVSQHMVGNWRIRIYNYDFGVYGASVIYASD